MKFRGGLGSLVLVFAWLGVGSGSAQETAPFTLHVYEDTIQIPVLVLSRNRQRMAPLAGSKFSVSLDSGPQFRPSHVRLEGDDPISLAILLNLSSPTWPMLTDMDKAFGLAAKDHVSVFVLACGLVRLMEDVPADGEGLKQVAEDGFRIWKERTTSPCEQPVAFRDDIGYVVHELAKVPGRRVLLAITDGQDSGSRISWNDLRIAAQGSGTAIFGMRVEPFGWVPGEDQFDALCQLSGGLLAAVRGSAMNERLKDFAAMVRGRYIVEFPRPAKFSTGAHSIEVAIAGVGDAYVRSSGLAVPLQDPKVLSDPTTVPGDPAKTPELGSREALTR